ncbi:MAG: hypothetical protein SFV53_03880, partial [Rickettsiales bacterium]|nr:hypothetical protein [Rickettsiales bacterium]
MTKINITPEEKIKFTLKLIKNNTDQSGNMNEDAKKLSKILINIFKENKFELTYKLNPQEPPTSIRYSYFEGQIDDYAIRKMLNDILLKKDCEILYLGKSRDDFLDNSKNDEEDKEEDNELIKILSELPPEQLSEAFQKVGELNLNIDDNYFTIDQINNYDDYEIIEREEESKQEVPDTSIKESDSKS